jgi:phosphopantothenoylcysteine decarboxylase/phosphopantothenate--cysteine ligase
VRGRHIVLGVTGGIAAYKAAELARFLAKEGAEVRVVMTRNACEFVTPLTFESLTGRPVARELFDRRTEEAHAHVELARWAELLIVAPATANAVAKLALGLADDLLSTTALACRAPVVLAPAMNAAMWEHPASRSNVETLRERGVRLVGPAEGELACGESGPGRMADPAEIVEAAREALAGAPPRRRDGA